MTSANSSSTFCKLASLGAWLAFAVACGGRVTTDSNSTGGTNDPGNSTTTGDTTTTTTTGYMGDTGGASNSSNAGGDNSSGTSGAFNGSGGTIGAGGTVISCTGPCDAVACGPGSYSYTFPGACCPTCVQCNVLCPACPPGTHPQAVPNQCCGMCVVDQQPSCDSGRMSYEAFRSQLLDKYGSPGCTTDDNCVLASEINRCVARCGVALPVVTSGDWKSNTISYADANCSSCPVSPPIPCPPFQARCVMGRCSLGRPAPH